MSVRRSIVLGFAIALLLAGCQGEPEPRVEPTSSESSSAIDPSEQPEPQTAEEFIDEWFRLGTEMQNTGSTEEFRAASHNCRPCDEFAESVEQIYRAGGFIQIDSEEVVSTQPLRGRPANRPEFVVKVRASPTSYKESSTAENTSLPGGLNTYEVSLVKRPQGWAISTYLDRS
jgi:hypothetical protein